MAAAIAGRYAPLVRLGAGALGEVWAARDLKTERDVALKLLVPKWRIPRSSLDLFFRDAKQSAKIRQPSVVELLDLGEADHKGKKTPFVVLELLEAEKLEQVLEREGPLPVGTVLRLASELAWALVMAHERSIVHERVEPANVLLHRDVRGEIVPKLVDFGIARLVDDLEVKPGAPHEALSPIEYLSPEQIHADVALDGRADVFGLGALMHRCLTGEPPFTGETADDVLAAIEAGPKKLEAFEPPIDAKVVHLVADALQRNRRLRPTMRVLAERIDALRERFDAQWRELGERVRIPIELTLERIAAMRTSLVEEPPISSQPVSDSEVEEVPPSSERLSASDLEDAPPSAPPPEVRPRSVPPPLPKSVPPPSAPISHLIREKMKSTASDALALDVLAELESELLKHVESQRASEPGAIPPAPAVPTFDEKPPPSGGVLESNALAPSPLWSSPPTEATEAAGAVSVPKAKSPVPSATAKTLPPTRERARKGLSPIAYVAAAVAAIVLLVVAIRGSGNKETTPAAPAPSAPATAAPTDPANAAPTPSIAVAPAPPPPAASETPPPPAETIAAPPPATTAAPPPAATTAAPPPPATTAAPPPAKTAAPPPATTATPPAKTAAPSATAAPKPSSTAPKPVATTKSTNDPYFGVESAGF